MEENTLQSNCDEDGSTKVSMRNTKGIRIYGSPVISNVTCTKVVVVIPLNAALQFWNPTMASFMQKVK